MKRTVSRLILLAIFSLFVITGWESLLWQNRQSTSLAGVNGDYIRLHVVANSDGEFDQQLKLQVRDAVLSYLNPYLSDVNNISKARQMIDEHKQGILTAAQDAVRQNNHDYKIELETGNFQFPLKTYGNVTLPSGEYEAVKIKIGQAQGGNWWCVLFPPLCFVDGTQSTALMAKTKKIEPGNDKQQEEIKFRWKIVELLSSKNE